ncbi:hypothetical protein RQP46_000172 [Phenoliferia psychrophenolica]
MLPDTDAGDYTIGEAHAPAVATKKPAAGPQGPVFGIPPKLEPFVLIAKSARGAAAANLVGQATAAPGVFVFSELLEIQGIKDLATHETYASSHRLLELFAYGTWGDYAAEKASLPTLNKAQETKLKHLTILTLAMENRIIPYAHLLSTLDLPSIPALEDLLIEAFYSNILTGRLDQKEARLEVVSGLGRDVRPVATSVAALSLADDAMEVDADATATTPAAGAHSITSLTTNLSAWLSTIGSLLTALERHLGTIAADSVNDVNLRTEQDKAVGEMVTEVSAASKDGKDKNGGGNILGGGGNGGGGGGGTSWTRDLTTGVMGKLGFGGGGGNSGGGDQDMDLGGSSSGGGRGGKGGGRAKKRGRF